MRLMTPAIWAFFLCPMIILGQDLPLEGQLTDDGRLVFGASPVEGFYDMETVHKLEVTLSETNWFDFLDDNDGASLIGTVTLDDQIVFDSVLVSIKGNTSDRRNNSEKKSFKLEFDEYIDQDLLGYDNLNLNCAFEDESGMREVLYSDICRTFTPALKGSFVDLYINGQDWGPYNNIQQIEGTYIKEWFTNNDGTRWRALASTATGGPGGNRFGAGTSTLNYNGSDSTDYNTDYTLKRTEKENPWEDLIEACDDLNNTAIDDLYDELKYTLDIDRALWFLIQENVFADDDSYINKGGMDYYVYWDQATDRIIPMEVDGNSVLDSRYVDWSPFYNEDDSDFPLMNRLLQNEEIRQRYLAHYRTVLDQYFTEEKVHARIDELAMILDQRVQDDPKKLYSYNEFLNGVVSLKQQVSNRIDNLSTHVEIDRTGIEIEGVQMRSVAGIGMAPLPEEEVVVTSTVSDEAQKLVMYYAQGLDGVFERIEMLDDGLHGDGAAGDNVYGAMIPGYAAGTFVRYYVEAIKDDAFATASYYPAGAEHDVFVYQVEQTPLADSDIVINEFVADNGNGDVDNAGENEDWVELYNKGVEVIDLSNYYLTDDEGDMLQWQFPANTTIAPETYLIIWLDDDEDQATSEELHATFKLSKDGETIILVNADGEAVDRVVFGAQQEDVSFARMPNGVGDFVYSSTTFNASNNGATTSTANLERSLKIDVYPNPATSQIVVTSDYEVADRLSVSVFNTLGQPMITTLSSVGDPIDISGCPRGMYIVVLQDIDTGATASKRLIILN